MRRMMKCFFLNNNMNKFENPKAVINQDMLDNTDRRDVESPLVFKEEMSSIKNNINFFIKENADLFDDLNAELEAMDTDVDNYYLHRDSAFGLKDKIDSNNIQIESELSRLNNLNFEKEEISDTSRIISKN